MDGFGQSPIEARSTIQQSGVWSTADGIMSTVVYVPHPSTAALNIGSVEGNAPAFADGVSECFETRLRRKPGQAVSRAGVLAANDP